MPAYRTCDASARNLGVSTDAPPPPTVSITSPTPRAFTFPITDTHFPNLPSSSPFEPTSKSTPSTPPPLRPFSPSSSIGSDSSISVLSYPTARSSSQASSHRRHRATVSDAGEQRPKKGDDDYIKRPENAFILFGLKKWEERQAAQEEDDGSSGPVQKQVADPSSTISQQWKSLPLGGGQYREDLMKEKKEHEATRMYFYRPQRGKDRKTEKGTSCNIGEDTDTEPFSLLMPVSSSPSSRSLSRDYLPAHSHDHGRRAASAPTSPPAFQVTQLPSVWMPSCSTSPTLVPRISRRSPAPMPNIPPPTESAPFLTFDYALNDNLFMSFYQAPSAFDSSSLQIFLSHSDVYQQYQHMCRPPEGAGMIGGPLLHALSIPPHDANAMPHDTLSPSESIDHAEPRVHRHLNSPESTPSCTVCRSTNSRSNGGIGGLKVTYDMRLPLNLPGWLPVDLGGQALRTLYQKGSKPLDPRLPNDFAQPCFYEDVNGVKRMIENETAPSLEGISTPYCWGYATLVVIGVQRIIAAPHRTRIDNKATLECLLENGAPSDVPDIVGYCAFQHTCTNYPRSVLARILLEHGADPNYQDKFGSVALVGACQNNCVGAVAALMGFGASMDIEDADQCTPEEFYVKCGPTVIAAIQKWKRKRVGESSPLDEPACPACGEEATVLKFCVTCHAIRYCSKDCQRSRWFIHKTRCIPFSPESTVTLTPFDEDIGPVTSLLDMMRQAYGFHVEKQPTLNVRAVKVPYIRPGETKSIIKM